MSTNKDRFESLDKIPSANKGTVDSSNDSKIIEAIEEARQEIPEGTSSQPTFRNIAANASQLRETDVVTNTTTQENTIRPKERNTSSDALLREQQNLDASSDGSITAVPSAVAVPGPQIGRSRYPELEMNVEISQHGKEGSVVRSLINHTDNTRLKEERKLVVAAEVIQPSRENRERFSF